MIYIMGDLHGHIYDYERRIHAKNIQLNEKDIIIICGDFTFIYDESIERTTGLKKLSEQPCELLFVCGNHEDFARLNSFPRVLKYGGLMHKIADNIYYMPRGNTYFINGMSFFTFGGAYSNPYHHSKMWSSEEVPNNYQFEIGKNALMKINNSIDYIVTHSAPNEILCQIGIDPFYTNTEFSNFLSWMLNNVQYKKWFCGHYHIDCSIDEYSFMIVYDDIIELG